ncbi:hypothetical protein FBUS_01285 [Fasciolopsis buskii]|uniref:G-protein coupled receptors family 1 profile domain-containing protein n=1 Tax=Fasciolopsis buskii TaxID=27845 RepID=A0A8E0RR24_9TREM|nr:hypothetical protein FBUS_01285 [Fasciolopsis buski]
MNTTSNGWIYEPVRIPLTTPVFFGLVAPLLIMGAMLNMITCYGVHCIQLESLLTRCLLYNECVFDMLVCSSAFYLFIPFGDQTIPGQQNVFTCYVIRNAFLMSFLRMLMNFNIVCLACDRFWAIVYYRTYKQRQMIYVVLSYSFIFFSATTVTLPTLFQVSFISGLCVAIIHYPVVHISKITNIIVAYAIPVSIVVITGLWASRALKKQNSASTQVTSINSVGKYGRTIDPSLIAVQNTLSAATFGFCFVFAFLAMVGTVMSVLSITNRLDFRFDSVSRMYFNCTCGLASSLIPVINLFTVPPLRRWYLESIRNIYARLTSAIHHIVNRCSKFI